MVKHNGKSYKICLLDTCAISDFFEDNLLYFRFLKFRLEQNMLIGITISSIIELKKSSRIFHWFKNEFIQLPSFLLKPADFILEDEINSFPNENTENVLALFLYNEPKFFDTLENSKKFEDAIKFTENNKPIVLNSILELKKNFPADKNGKYSKNKIEEFVDKVTKQQLSKFYSNWFDENKIEFETQSKLFKSIRAQLLITFWKFYKLKDRKSKNSDIFDISIVSTLPYVHTFITEKNMKNDILQIKKSSLHFANLEVLTMKDLKV